MEAELQYLIRHAIHDYAKNRLRQGGDPEGHAKALDFLQSGLLSDQERNGFAAELARHARLARQSGSPAIQRALTDIEHHYLSIAYRRALADSRLPEALALAERLAAHDDVSAHDRSDALLKVSVALRMDQRHDEAVEFARRALAAAEGPNQQAWTEQELANALVMGRNLEEAEEYYARALDRAGENQDGRLEAAALCNLGSVRRQQGRGQEAGVLYRRAIEVGREAGARDYEGTAHLQLGYLLTMQGEEAAAESELRLAVEVLEETSKALYRVDAASNLGDIATRAGRYEEAEKYIELALAIAREFGYRPGLAQALNYAAIFYDESGRPQEALLALRESVEVARESGDQMNLAYGLTNLGLALLRAEQLKESADALDQARAAAQLARNPYAEGGAVSGLGDVRRKQGALMEAWNLYEHAVHLMDMAGYPPGALRNRIKLSAVNGASGDAGPARDTLRELVSRAEELGARDEYELASVELARVEERLGDHAAAVLAWQKAVKVAAGEPAKRRLESELAAARQRASS
ncbi:MAG: tetratricopeptide repeat protein [Planctomycetes bacterium]|nr:tetratricopeptide repeat protein [Planctomycetota bacterium]